MIVRRMSAAMCKAFPRAAILLMIIAPLLASASVHAQTPPATEWAFEQAGEEGALPEGWFVPTTIKAAGWEAKVVDVRVDGAGVDRAGRVLELSCVPVEGKSAPFGNVMTSIDAKAYRGKAVRVSALVPMSRAEAGRAQVWLRVDRPEGRRGFFDNMGDRAVTSREFQQVILEGRVDEDAESINFGLMVVGGNGPAQIDQLRVEATEPKKPRFALPKELSERGLANLRATAKVMGYLRHYHPSDECAKVDWDGLTIDAVLACENAETPEALVAAWSEKFGAIAPTARFASTPFEQAFDKAGLKPADLKATRVVHWHHIGYGGPKGTSSMVYRSRRVYREIDEAAPEGSPRLGDVVDRAIPLAGGSVYVRIPLVLASDGVSTLPQGATPTPESAGTEASGEDRATRLAGVMIAWNICQHFYPYFDVVKTDWDGALSVALKKAGEQDRETNDFVHTLLGLASALHDGHGNAFHAQQTPLLTLPIDAAFIGDKLVVTAAGMGAEAKCAPGDEIVSIAGPSVQELLERARTLEPASTEAFFKHRAVRRVLSRERRDGLALKFRTPDGTERSSAIRPEDPKFQPHPERPEPFAEVAPGIIYLDVDRVDGAALTKNMAKLEAAKGIIVDVRGYPAQFPWTFLGQLTDTPLQSPQWHIPVCDFPDGEHRRFEQSGWPLPPSKPRLTAPVVFIIDARAISAAETFMGIVANYKLGAIVGEPTAGTNGNVNPINLPGGFAFMWTGMKVLDHDGKQHHGVGVQPTVPISPTIEGLAARRDELLDKAVEVVQKAGAAKGEPSRGDQPSPDGQSRD